MKEKKTVFLIVIHSAFFDTMLQLKVRQVGLSEIRYALLTSNTHFCD